MSRFRLAILSCAIVLSGPAWAAGDEAAELRATVARLEAEIQSLKEQIAKLTRENEELQALLKLNASQKTLSEILKEGAVFHGSTVLPGSSRTADPKDVIRDVTLTITERKENTFKATFRVIRPSQSDFVHEVSGKITANNVGMKSLDSPRPFTLNGKLHGGSLDLQFNGATGKAAVKLKVE